MTEDEAVARYLAHGVMLEDVVRDGLLLLSVKNGIAVVGMHGEPAQPGDPAFVVFMQKIDRIILFAGASNGATPVVLSRTEFELALE